MFVFVQAALLASVPVPPVTVEVDGFCLREEVAPPFEALRSASWILVRTSTTSLAVSVVTPDRQLERSLSLEGGCAVAAERAALMIERALEPMFDGGVGTGLELRAPPTSAAPLGYAFGASWLVDTGRLRTGPGVFVRAGVGRWFGELAGGLLLSETQSVARAGQPLGEVAAWSAFGELRGAGCFAWSMVETCGRLGAGAERTTGRASGDLIFARRLASSWGFRGTATVTAELTPLRPVFAVLFAGAVWRPGAPAFEVDAAGPAWQPPEIAALFGLELGFSGTTEIF